MCMHHKEMYGFVGVIKGSAADRARWQRVMHELGLDGKGLLAAWLYEHFDNPFPLPEEKDMLAAATGMPRTQVLLAGARCWQQTHHSLHTLPKFVWFADSLRVVN